MDGAASRLAADHGDRFLDVEAEQLIERERAHVERVLLKPDAGRPFAAFHHRLHQLASDACILALGIDADRTDAPDRIALVEEVGADYPSILLCDHPPDRGMWDPDLHDSSGGLEHREIERKAVVVLDTAESIEQDLSTGLGVAELYLPQRYSFRGLGGNGVGHGSPSLLEPPANQLGVGGVLTAGLSQANRRNTSARSTAALREKRQPC